MATCSMCGNNYKNSFGIIKDEQRFSFDCFECAIHKLAPTCSTCGCRIIGHGIEADDRYYCCSNCARELGVKESKDHVETSSHSG